MKRLYQESINHCLRKNDISSVCVDFLKTGKMQKGCVESCANPDCVENLEQCVLQIKEMKEMNEMIDEPNGEFIIRIL